MRRVLIIGTVAVLAIAMWGGAYIVASATSTVARELDRAAEFAKLHPRAQTTVVFDRHGNRAFTFFAEQRTDVPLDRVSPAVIDALLAIEDQRFFDHHGLDLRRVIGAAWYNLRAGHIVQGGSTLTQQLARSGLSPRRTFSRKLREALIAVRLEERYSKREILEAYLNTVYFGEGYYGVEAAARGYFGKPASELDVDEAALLAAVVRSPSLDAPCVSPERARIRRNLVLRLMREQGRLAQAEYRTAVAAPIPDASHRTLGHDLRAGGASGNGLYFEEELRRQLVAQFGNERVLRGGLRVYSTYDPAMQKAAAEAVTRRIAEIARRGRARDLQGALVAMDPATGDVFALVGGRDFAASSFNRATQAKRQAGSAFKPIIFATALERGYAPGTMLTELDRVIGSGREAWLPGGEHERSEYTLRRALKVSSNRAAAQLLQQVGITTATYFAQRLGIESALPMVPSLALGTGEVTLLELTASYTAFANHGVSSAPRLFTRVDDPDGVTIYHRPERHARVLSEATAYMMSSMLADVVSGGTAAGARTAGFKLPAAGKTGTSDDYADAWFIGYTPRLVTGVWFGLDRPAPIMARGFGGVVAVPAWARFMREATKGHRAEWFEMPASVERVAICRRSAARATDACRHDLYFASGTAGESVGIVPASFVTPSAEEPPEPPVFEDLFPVGTIPSELCPLHASRRPVVEEGREPPARSPTPLVDAALRGGSIRRVVGSDGIVRYVRQ